MTQEVKLVFAIVGEEEMEQRGFNCRAYLEAVRIKNMTLISLLHPYNYMTEDEVWKTEQAHIEQVKLVEDF